jgi:ribonucleotide reductase class II
VRPQGEKLKGFGGVANPIKLPDLYKRCSGILNKAVGRKLNSVECCLLIDEAATTIVSGNIRRSAGMRQGDSNDRLFASAKDNLWQQDENGNWRIDPERDSLRMANHTRVFHNKPTLEECIDAVRKQYYSGEGAIQWAGETIARANADLLDTTEKKKTFLRLYENDRKQASLYLASILTEKQGVKMEQVDIQKLADELEHRMSRLGLNPCGR